MEKKYSFNDTVRHIDSGLEGVVTGLAQFKNSPDQVFVQPKMQDGKFIDAKWFAVGEVELIESAK